MEAAVYQTPRQLSVKDLPDPRIERLTGLDRAAEADKHVDHRDDGWKPTTVGRSA